MFVSFVIGDGCWVFALNRGGVCMVPEKHSSILEVAMSIHKVFKEH